MLSLTGMLLIGLVAGLISQAVRPGAGAHTWIMTLLLGVAGSFLASYIGIGMGWYQQDDDVGWIASVAGAVALLALFSLVKMKP